MLFFDKNLSKKFSYFKFKFFFSDIKTKIFSGSTNPSSIGRFCLKYGEREGMKLAPLLILGFASFILEF